MKFPSLKIDSLRPVYPIIQGGMAIRISMANLASAVANEGGIGVIGGTGLTIRELRDEIRKAKAKTKGIIGVNLMFAASNFMESLKASIDAGVDLIISGAGFSRDMFAVGKAAKVPIVPIVSSLKLAKISEKLGASAVIVEGGNAGGHLGTDQDSWDIIQEIKENISLPVIAAGDAIEPRDVHKMFQLGVNGVQMGTRFLASVESEVSDVYKNLCVMAQKDDVITIMSSTGYPANALKSKMSELVQAEEAPRPQSCSNCLKQCTRKFCINEALVSGSKGDLEKGIFFTGKGVWKIKEILSVRSIFKEIIHFEE